MATAVGNVLPKMYLEIEIKVVAINLNRIEAENDKKMLNPKVNKTQRSTNLKHKR